MVDFPEQFGRSSRLAARAGNALTYTVCLFFFSILMLLLALGEWQKERRLAQDPVVSAVITKSWDVGGKYPSHRASISYWRLRNGETVPCHVNDIRIGPIGDRRGVGDHIQIAPRADSCYEPDIPGLDPSGTAKFFTAIGGGGLALAICMAAFIYRRSRSAQPRLA
jgi:hypothetical protein